MPTVTSISTSGTRALTAAAMVSSESTATVMRAEPLSITAVSRVRSRLSLASSRSSPSPAAAMPIISRTVAQQNPRWPFSASRRASAVDLNAFTWGRSFSPGHRFAIVATFRSNACTSTSSDGVGRS